MEALMKSITLIVLKTLGLKKIIDLWASHPWLTILMVVCISLTLVWMFKFKDGKAAAALGKFPGSLAAALIHVLAGAAIAMALLYMLIQFALEKFLTAADNLSSHLGDFLRGVVDWTFEPIAAIVVPFAIGIWIILSFSRVIGMVWSAFTGAAQNWADPKGPHGVKLWYQVAGSVVVAVLICNPEWNLPFYYAPALLSSLLGVYTLHLAYKAKQAAPTPTAPDPEEVKPVVTPPTSAPKAGKVRCVGQVPVRNAQGKVRRAKGPDGKPVMVDGKPQPMLKECGTLYAKEATCCPECGTLNPRLLKTRPQPTPQPPPAQPMAPVVIELATPQAAPQPSAAPQETQNAALGLTAGDDTF
jgi:hypothetical protein